MAKLYFYYAAMNAGKTTSLLQSNYNYRERGMETLLLLPEKAQRTTSPIISSRIGLKSPALPFPPNLLETLERAQQQDISTRCILVDEAQFLSKNQVEQLCTVVDELHIPVLAYGLRTDFQGNLFEGSRYLLAWAEELIELKTMCHCGKKATMNMRVDANGNPIISGPQVELGGNERYMSTCRYHHKAGVGGAFYPVQQAGLA